MTDSDTCSRCGRLVDIRDSEYAYGEWIDGQYVGQCCIAYHEPVAIHEEDAELEDKAALAALLKRSNVAHPG